METTRRGMVILVGAGPGDPGLITLRGWECLQKAEVVIHDFLLNRALLAYAPNAEIINVAQQPERHPRSLGQINALMIEKARQGKLVVRLKGGDPLVFGRGGEEALALTEAGIPFQIVPGVTSATAVPTYAGIPITQRGIASSLAVIAGHNLENAEALDWPHLAHGADTLLFLMGIQALPFIVSRLLAAGRAPDTPIGIVEQGTHPGQKTVVGTLTDIVAKTTGIKPPATIIVGDVVKLRDKLRWFDRPDLNPLFGLRIMTVHGAQAALAADLNYEMAAQGAEAVSFSPGRIGPVSNPAPLTQVLAALTLRQRPLGAPWDDLIFRDAQAVAYFFDALFASGGDARALGGLRLGALNPAAAAALRVFGLVADFVGGDSGGGSLAGRRVLLLGAARMESDLVAMLKAQDTKEESVAVYCHEPAPSLQPWLDWLSETSIQDNPRVVVFTDPWAVEGMAHFLPGPALAQALAPVRVICAGPGTAATASAFSVRVDGVAAECTVEAMAEALRPWRASAPQET
jgi:uroporphyrinogen III methyltransferase / synthase